MSSASPFWLPLVAAALLAPLATAHEVADAVQLIQTSVGATAHAAAGTEAARGQRSRRSGALEVAQASSRLRRRRDTPVTDRLLIFWATGSSQRTMDLVVNNINHVRRFEDPSMTWPLQIDVYFAHYDMKRSVWQQAMGDWYGRNVQFSAELKGIKFWLAKDLLLWNYSATTNFSSGGRPDMDAAELAKLPKVNIHSYEYIWFLDEDVNFQGMDLRLMIDFARRSGANILTPAIVMKWTEADVAPPRPPSKKPWRIQQWRDIESCKKYHNCSNKVEAVAAAKIDSLGNIAKDALRKALKDGEVGRPDLLGIKPVRNESDWSAPTDDGLVKSMKSRSSSGCQVWDTVCHLQAPSPKCHWRYTNFVEVSFPMMKPKAFVDVLHRCSVCLSHRTTIWGLDRVWCRKSAGNSKHEKETSCVVVDAVKVMHMNYKTLPKWDEGTTGRQEDWDACNEVQRAEKDSFALSMKTFSCFKYPPKLKS